MLTLHIPRQFLVKIALRVETRELKLELLSGQVKEGDTVEVGQGVAVVDSGTTDFKQELCH